MKKMCPICHHRLSVCKFTHQLPAAVFVGHFVAGGPMSGLLASTSFKTWDTNPSRLAAFCYCNTLPPHVLFRSNHLPCTQTHPDAPRRTRRTQNFLRLLRGASGKPRGLNTECVRDAICCSAPGCATEASSSVPSDWDFGAIHRGGESEAQGRGLAGTRAGVGGRAPV